MELIGIIGILALDAAFYASISFFNDSHSYLRKRIKLSKFQNDSNIQIIDYNNILKRDKKHIAYKDIDFYQKEKLIPFLEKLREEISEEDIQIAYQNVNTLKIKYEPWLIRIENASGIYYPRLNEIEYAKEKSLGHEFLHMASSTYDKDNNITLVGFQVKITNSSDTNSTRIIGEELNEGYTELLASRLYTNEKPCFMYRNFAKIAELIELFFDNPKDMAHLYFTHDLYGLIQHLEQFASREEIIKMILEIECAQFTSISNIPFSTINFIKIQLKLYEWFSSKITDPSRLQQFSNLICKNPIAAIALNTKKIICSREQSYQNCKLIFEDEKTNQFVNQFLPEEDCPDILSEVDEHPKIYQK